MYVIISGIKSEKTKNAVFARLDQVYYPTVAGKKGNYQVRTNIGDHGVTPVSALKEVYDELTNLTDDHKANLSWKVKK